MNLQNNLQNINNFINIDSISLITQFLELKDISCINNKTIISRYVKKHKTTILCATDNKCLNIIKYINNYIYKNNHFYLDRLSREMMYARSAMIMACVYGYLEIVEYLHKKINVDIEYIALNSACQNGHLHIVKYIVKVVKNISADPLYIASDNGNFDIVKYFIENKIISCNDYIIQTAIRLANSNNHNEIADYLRNMLL